MRSDLTNNILRILTSVVLLLLGSWSFYHNWLQKPVRFDNYTYSIEEAERLKNYSKAQYAHGLNAWSRQDPEAAARFFRQAVSEDILFIDGWIRLAEAESEMGRKEKAKNILTFTIDRTKRVSRWKWPQMLLSRELGMDEVIYSNANYLLSCGILEQDTLQFLHTHLGGNASAVVSVLDEEHLDDYLEWLMNWSMIEESLKVWRTMTAFSTPENETALRFANFLLHNKHITESKDIWQKYTGIFGLTNPGFETELTCRGFDWSYWKEKDGLFEIKRINHDTWEGDYALRVNFSGRENIAFYHFYQIITADPQAKYHLTYAWKSQGITTDQGPFIEIYGYDKEGLYKAGPMITGTQEWRDVSIEFDMPEGCQAAVVRLCRRPSNRFDSKIRGSLWLDDFRLEKIGKDTKHFSSENIAPQFYLEFMQKENLYLSMR
jgi:hypothetical protein